MKMFYVQYIYLLLVLVTGITTFFNASFSVAISGLIAPIIAWAGGSGLRGSFYGNKKQTITGIVFGLVFLAISFYWISKTQYWVHIFNVSIQGEIWILIGFFVGLIFTTKDHYLNKFK